MYEVLVARQGVGTRLHTSPAWYKYLKCMARNEVKSGIGRRTPNFISYQIRARMLGKRHFFLFGPSASLGSTQLTLLR